jgi:molybdenum cofactor cytidylyltransferase
MTKLTETRIPGGPTGFCFAAVILAAGASSRMGQPKMLMPWGQRTIVEHMVHTWSGLGAQQVAVVIASRDEALRRELRRIHFPSDHVISNPEPARGMFSSVRCAAQWSDWSPAVRHWAIALGDQPHLATMTLRHLLGEAAHHPHQICQPAYQGRPAHPVVLPLHHFQCLATTQAPTLKSFLQERQSCVYLADCGDAGLGVDLDRPEDYQIAWKTYGANPEKKSQSAC